MAVAQLGGSTVASYTYDATGERIQKVAGAATERYGYDESQQLLSERGATNRDYVWMDGIPVANVDTTGTASTIAYVTADQLGTPRAITDANGTIDWQLPYQGNAFEELPPTSTTGYAYNLRSAGEYFDAETGLNNNGYRTRDAGTWRFLQSDPLGLGGGISTYAAVGNDPLSYIDPLGLQTQVGAWPVIPVTPCASCHSPVLPVPPPSSPGQFSVPNSGVGGDTGAIPDTDAPAKPKVCPPPPRDPCQGIVDQLEAHRKKLDDYMADPTAHDNLGRLSSAAEDLQEKVYQGRIMNLVAQIASFDRQLAKCRAENGGE
jgi:RHS repeat-associated protein